MQILCAFDFIQLSNEANAETSSSCMEMLAMPLEIASTIYFPQLPKIIYEVKSECHEPEHVPREKTYLSTFSRR